MTSIEQAKFADDMIVKSIPTELEVNDLAVLHNQLLAERFEADFNRIFEGKSHATEN